MTLLKPVIGFAAAVTLLFGAELKTETAPLVTHEWGTFTSVANENGDAVESGAVAGPRRPSLFRRPLARGL